MVEWQYKTDPYEIIPIGFRCSRNKYKVVGFCAPAGLKINRLMVYIKYDSDNNGNKYSTTLNYLLVLYNYFNTIKFPDFVKNHL